MEHRIILKLDESNSIDIDSNTPDMNAIIELIVNLKDTIDSEKISIICEEPSFDKIGFEKMMKEIIKRFIDEINIEKKSFNEAMNVYCKKRK
ncbi:MAG: hypothetical protein Q4C49_07510 [Bacillota bacterium]|nr:hypothetical protein [Bacillota bacterium]